MLLSLRKELELLQLSIQERQSSQGEDYNLRRHQQNPSPTPLYMQGGQSMPGHESVEENSRNEKLTYCARGVCHFFLGQSGTSCTHGYLRHPDTAHGLSSIVTEYR